MSSRRVASSAAIATLVLLPASADAYRPFISTDADTAAYGTIELELGFFGLQRQDGRTHGQTPQAVLNYGFRPGFEAVGQLYLDEPPVGGARVLDAELSVKNVLRRGVLQDKPGPSVAMDSLLLLPGAGLIAEHPLAGGVRAVGELAGEAVNTLTPENSGLLGLIWSSGWRDADFDLGARRGLGAAAPPWSAAAGISIPFAVDGSPDSNPRRPND